MLRKLVCPHCGAPLPAVAAMARDAQCSYCGLSFAVGPDIVSASDFRAAREGAEREAALEQSGLVRVGGVTYRPTGRLAHGESSDVFLAERVTPVPERVVIKVLRASGDADLLAREEHVLSSLQTSRAKGSDRLSNRVAQSVAFGRLEGDGSPGRPVGVLRYISGFFQTFVDVRRAYPGGIDPPAAAWIWRRILEGLAWVHASGWAHAALVPPHLLVHPRDHGVLLVGWSCAVKLAARQPPPALVAAHLDLYPREVREGGAAGIETDLVMAARCVVRLLGGEVETGRVPSRTPAPFAKLLREVATAGRAILDAWALHSAVGEAARESFGAPAYHPFDMPGWN
jgi:hypothetical protein